MKRADNKSRCPINFTVEIFGDTWSLLIVRDLATLGKKTFSEFLDSPERIGPSVLADRLAHLEEKGIIAKAADAVDKRKMIYTLTDTGIALVPIIYEIAVWGSHVSPRPEAPDAWFAAMKLDKEIVLAAWHRALKAGSSFFNGPHSVIVQLGL